MRLKLTPLVLFILAFMDVNAQTKESPAFGKGIFNLVGKDSTWTMKIAARMRFLITSTWPEGQKNESEFLVRRARLKFEGFAYSPKLQYKLELGFSNNEISGASEFTSNAPGYFLDAVIKWNFYENFELWFGQTKLPGNRERVISSGNMQMLDRSLLNSKFSIEHDLGFQLHHHINITNQFIIKEAFAFSQGEGRNMTIGNLGGNQYSTRIEVLPFGDFVSKGDYSGEDLNREVTQNLAIGTTYDLNDNAVKTRSNQGSYLETDNGFYETNISTVFADAMFKYQGFAFMAEYVDRNTTNPYAENSDGIFTGDIVQVGNGLNLQTGYVFNTNWGISGRYTAIKLDRTITGKDTVSQYTFGISKYIVGHELKVQSDISHLEVANGTNELMYRLQFDIHL